MTITRSAFAAQSPKVYYLKRALEAAVEMKMEPFRLGDIERVFAFWEDMDGSLTRYGYDLLLKDGGRRYLEYVLDESGSPATEKVEIRLLELDQSRDAIEGVAHWSDAFAINEALGLDRRH